MPEREVTKKGRIPGMEAMWRSNICVEEADMTSAMRARIDGRGGIAHV